MNFQAIEINAYNLLHRFGVHNPSVDVNAIAEKLGIEVNIGEMDQGISGVIYREKGKAVIGLNKDDTAERNRFTIAHEIGHFMMHRDQDLHVDSEEILFRRTSELGDPKETAANVFAAALLMPKAFLMKESKPSLKNISKLAEKYNVSSQAMSYRLVNLGLVPLF